jgi:ubiquinone biosynthesis protein
VSGLLERAGQVLRWGAREQVAQLTPPQRVRMALAELGPTFVKLGQVLATRVDLFPPDWIAEFETLQANVPPVPFDTLLPEIERALGRSPLELFRDLEREPLGAASIAQVHGAKLPDGAPVVLKVMRPDILPKIEADLRILGHLAAMAESELPESRRFQPVQMVASSAARCIAARSRAGRARKASPRTSRAVGRRHPPSAGATRTVNVQQRVAGIRATIWRRSMPRGWIARCSPGAARCVLKMIWWTVASR